MVSFIENMRDGGTPLDEAPCIEVPSRGSGPC
jgi:hypothetical protein